MIETTKRIPDFKAHRYNAAIIEYTKPKYLYFPTVDLRCPTGETCVVDGQRVKVGELIGTRDGGFFKQPIYSSVSGKVVGVEKKLHGSGQMVDCLIIENDFKDELHESCEERTEKEITDLSKDQLVEIMEEAGLAGLGGGAFPTFIKYKTTKPIEYVVANGVECEPFIVSDYQIMLAQTKKIVQGLTYAMRTVGAPKGVIAIKEKYQEVKQAFLEAIAEFSSYNLEVKGLNNVYPQGWENMTIKSATGIDVPVGDLTADHGVIVSNVSTLYGIYSAVKHRRPFTERFFSVAGNGIKEEKSFLVKIGTPVKDLVEQCGGYIDERPKVLICGGPMMGVNLTDDDFIVSQTTTSLVVLNEEETKEEPCVSCASCVYSCPVDIQPVQIMNAYKQRDKEAIEKLDVNRCIECGLCSFVCPSKIHLTEYMRQAKRFIK